jgi:hypothetical protein
MEFWRAKNTDTRVVFPIMKNDGTFITGATGLDSEYALLGTHGGSAPSFGDCTHEATEIGSTGLYYLDVSAAELNDDLSVIQVKSSSAGAITQVLLFRTTLGDVNVGAISGDTTAADNAESFFDGTGYAGTNNVIPTVTNVTAISSAIPGSPTADSIFERIKAIDDHVTADYGSTEKACIDLLDDASGGLADIHTDVGTAISDIATVDGNVDSILTDTGTTLDGYLNTVLKWLSNKLVRTDNLDGTITYVLYDDNNSSALKTWVYTTATGTRAKAT